MRNLYRERLTAVWMLTVIAAFGASGGPFKLDWSSVDGGGGNCAGGKLSLSGTVGQPDAGAGAGGSYALQGGFVPAFQKDVGPPLRMTRSGNISTFTWPTVCTGFVLEAASSVTGPWTPLGPGTVVGANWQFTLFAPTSPAFFRLRKDCPK